MDLSSAGTTLFLWLNGCWAAACAAPPHLPITPDPVRRGARAAGLLNPRRSEKIPEVSPSRECVLAQKALQDPVLIKKTDVVDPWWNMV
ncbi:Actin-Like Protein 6B [Manis pentadactyla]|nr:Actin-Like Protein 6B [Manis pentadactyla]